MNFIVKIWDDIDEWLAMAWLASGNRLWTLLVMFVVTLMIAGFAKTYAVIYLFGVVFFSLLGVFPAYSNSLLISTSDQIAKK